MSNIGAIVASLYASFNRFELELTQEQVDAIAQPGANDAAVAVVVADEAVIEQLDEAGAEAIRDELSEYGGWDDDELADDAQNRHRIVWIAAHNIADEQS